MLPIRMNNAFYMAEASKKKITINAQADKNSFSLLFVSSASLLSRFIAFIILHLKMPNNARQNAAPTCHTQSQVNLAKRLTLLLASCSQALPELLQRTGLESFENVTTA